MEDTLRGRLKQPYFSREIVLILVLMEDTLREYVEDQTLLPSSLNPCFNGRYSQRDQVVVRNEGPFVVLILVLMEDTLREQWLPMLSPKDSTS